MIAKDRMERFTVPDDAVWGANLTKEEIRQRGIDVSRILEEAIKRNAKLKEEQSKSN